jgi:signal transduction histidine kinase
MTATTAAPVRTPVLVVDDHDDNLIAVEAVLDGLGVDVIRASSGEEALRHLLGTEVALILLDVQMPVLDGFETARMIKSRARTANVPIIFLTALDRDIDHELEGYGTGAVDYLRKPFEPAVLRSKVAGFASLYRQAKTIEAQRLALADRVAERDRAEAALRRQAVELERSNAELERFALLTSQELREPLQVVTGLVELVLAGGRPEAEATELLQRAELGLHELSDRVAELLTYARSSAGALDVSAVPLDDVLAEVRAGLAPEIEAASASVTADPLPVVSGDRWQLSRLFAHLLAHALARPHPEGDLTIHVGLTREGESWVVSVRDNGTPLSREEMGSLFSMVGPGIGAAGMDLALARRIVQRHGGEVGAQSTPGRGTTVTFTLPVGTTTA